MHAQQVLLHLNLIDGVGPVVAGHIVSQCKKHDCLLPEIYRFSSADWCAWGIPEHRARLLVDGLANICMRDEELALIERHGVSLTTLIDEDYPVLLRQCYAPPTVLYWCGAKASARLHLAIIGSRAGTRYAQAFIDLIMSELARVGVVVVSGGAVGVDAMAHATACAHKAATTAVLGSGLLCPYPAANKELFRKIIDCGGALVSSFGLRTAPEKGHFPARNRIIAGMSAGVLVVQAAHKSGTHTTVQYALDYGRTVMAVPGPYDDHLSAGCNTLIAQGAHVAVSADDIFDALGLAHDVSKGKKQAAMVDVVPAKEPETISEKIVVLCAQARSFDDLVISTESDEELVRTELFELQINGVIEQNFAGLFQRVR